MIAALRTLTDQFLGRGAAAITVPIFDGALKANQILEQAETFAELEAPEDLATDGTSLFVADGSSVLRYDGDLATTVAQVDGRITALAVLPHGGLAVAIDGTEVRVIGGARDGQTLSSVAGVIPKRLAVARSPRFIAWTARSSSSSIVGRVLKIPHKPTITSKGSSAFASRVAAAGLRRTIAL